MGTRNPGARRYLREVRGRLPCGRKEKREILTTLCGSIETYLSENPDAGYIQLTSRFGTPDQIAASYVEEKEIEGLLRDLRVRRRIIAAVSVCLAVILFLWAGLVAASYVDHTRDVNGYAVVDIIELDRTTEDNGGK